MSNVAIQLLCNLVVKFESNASSAIWWANLQLMQVAHLVAKYATNASGAILLLNLIQVTESISGFVVPLAMFSGSTPPDVKSLCTLMVALS